jgi:Histidine kinase-, DNA gyrase B-, and HSP90-like ATPase.
MLVTLALSAWDLGELTDTAELIVSEFVGNAVRHTRCHHIQVTVTRLAPDLVRIAVIDRSTRRPAPRTAGADDEHGRGLAVVRALAEDTGTDTLARGKRVWAQLRTPGGEPPLVSQGDLQVLPDRVSNPTRADAS